jgi:peptidoglycan hydrolase CwlO-like protein
MSKSIQEKLQDAVQAQQVGVPVDWQAMCVEAYNTAASEVQRLQEEIGRLTTDLTATQAKRDELQRAVDATEVMSAPAQMVDAAVAE